MKLSEPKHPMQPIITDERGIERFKQNKIVRAMLDEVRRGSGGLTLHDIAFMEFSDEDRRQFAQLIGCSVSDYRRLSYVSRDNE